MDKIFISIASYRDLELSETLKNIILNAEHPELLRIVIYEQNDPSDPTVYGIYPESQVLVLRDHYSLAKGPNWARAVIQKEYNKEEYYLQIDSHMRCVSNWDTILKHMLDLVPEPAVLTQYPPEYDINTNILSKYIRSGLYIQGFGPKDRFTRIQSDIIKSENRRYFPYTSKAWSACFSFSKGNIIKDAPYDQRLTHLFFGEELDITLRLYTRGYYFFSPHVNIFYTNFNRDYRSTYWKDIPESERSPMELKSRNMLHNRIHDNEPGPYSLGTARSIEDYLNFADIESLKDCKMKNNAKTFSRYTNRLLLR